MENHLPHFHTKHLLFNDIHKPLLTSFVFLYIYITTKISGYISFYLVSKVLQFSFAKKKIKCLEKVHSKNKNRNIWESALKWNWKTISSDDYFMIHSFVDASQVNNDRIKILKLKPVPQSTASVFRVRVSVPGSAAETFLFQLEFTTLRNIHLFSVLQHFYVPATTWSPVGVCWLQLYIYRRPKVILIFFFSAKLFGGKKITKATTFSFMSKILFIKNVQAL